jgi:GNAT superfamily N-acetyltransferase
MTEIIYLKLSEEYLEHIGQAKKLIVEYVKWLNVDLTFQGFEAEMNTFPALYAEPFGCFLIALASDEVVGCVAMKPLNGGICEMKRLFVSDKFKGKGIGKELISRLIIEARKKGYKKMRLDTEKTRMIKAKSLYDFFGFVEIDAYVYNPYPDIVFMELEL